MPRHVRTTRELIYLSIAKVDELAPPRRFTFNTGRSFEVEAGIEPLGNVRLAIGERRANGTRKPRTKEAIKRVRSSCSAHTKIPKSCDSLLARDWVEFSGNYMCGPVMRDSIIPGVDRFQGVYGYSSFLNYDCGIQDCQGVEILLCGSVPHVLEYADAEPTRMGSRTEWVHDLAVRVAAAEAARQPTEPPSVSLAQVANLANAETAVRFAHDMLSGHAAFGPAMLHGHARVLFNFPPRDGYGHRMILATPLYVESIPRTTQDGSVFLPCPGIPAP
ncbi:SAVMC3_10250 family protein [Streptomyces sp. NPDC058385]|uniref:SAVMC3_10250 family protein n=1 Tax=Streptomyces sp. NPDC058385 TaxID=3346473 RepID=UPI00365CBD57